MNTANLTGIIVVFLLAIVNMFGVRLGALIQNIFTSAKALSMAGLVLLTLTIGRNATADGCEFRVEHEWVLEERGLACDASGSGGHRRPHRSRQSGRRSRGRAGGITVFV